MSNGMYIINSNSNEEEIGSLTTTEYYEPLLLPTPTSPSPSLLSSPTQPQLSLSLCISYSCIGMIMSLPNTALLYLINTYIPIPIQLLPLYMSISFLPYSLKPSYAYISSIFTSSSFVISRKIQISFLLCLCGIFYIITAFLPPPLPPSPSSGSSSTNTTTMITTMIVSTFVLAFLRSITLAWPNFLLDLSLLDEVVVVANATTITTTTITAIQVINDVSQQPPQPHERKEVEDTTSTKSVSSSYTEIAALFQSQAATYRSIGCIIANLLAVLIFIVASIVPNIWQQHHFDHYHNYNYNKNQHYTNQKQHYTETSSSTTSTYHNGSMNHILFQFILIVTGGINFICAIVVLMLKKNEATTNSNRNNNTIDTNSDNTDTIGNTIRHKQRPMFPSERESEQLILTEPLLAECHTNNVESKRIVPTTRRIPSYNSIEEENHDIVQSESIIDNNSSRNTSVLEIDSLRNDNHHSNHKHNHADSLMLYSVVSNTKNANNNNNNNNNNIDMIQNCQQEENALVFPSQNTKTVTTTTEQSTGSIHYSNNDQHNNTHNNNDAHQNNNNNNNNNSNSSIWLVILLQVLVVLFAMRQSMIQQHIVTKISWVCLVSTLIVISFFLVCNLYHQSYHLGIKTDLDATTNAATSTTGSTQQQRQLRVGLYLILRYSIPSVSYLMSSYVYTVYQEIPYILQIFSLIDMCITTVACYTYSKYLSRYSSTTTQLVWLIAITTILSGIASFGNMILIRILNPTVSPPYYSMSTKIACTICINAVIGFFNEWKFFPDVVLATVSVGSFDCNHSNTNTTDHSSTSLSSVTAGHDRVVSTDLTIDDVEPTTSFPQSCGNSENNNTIHNNDRNSQQYSSSSSSVGVQYGTLLSCIDFGDQIGLLLAGPLVAMFHTTRDDNDDPQNHTDWQHMEGLQMTNSIMILLSILLLFIIVR